MVWTLLVGDTESTATSYKDTGLDANKIYYYRVYALNGDHTGPVSIQPIYATVTTGPPVEPGQVTGLSATKGLAKEITLTWNQPADDGGSDITIYCVQVREVNPAGAFGALSGCTDTATTDFTTVTNEIGNDATGGGGIFMIAASAVEKDDGTASWTHEGIMDNETVEYRVTARNAQGTSDNSSNTAEGTTAGTTAPGMPMHIKLVGVSSAATGDANDVYLYWNRPSDVGTDVQVQRRVWVPGTGWSPNVWMDPDVAANNLAAGTNANHSQFHDAGAAYGPDSAYEALDRANGKVQYRVRYIKGDEPGQWAYSHELSMPFPQATVANDDSLPLISPTATDGDNLLRVVDDMMYFNRIDLRWMRQTFCSVGNGSDPCTTTSTTSTFAIDVAEGTIADGDAADGDDNKWDRVTPTISFSEALYRHLSNPSTEDATNLVSDETRTYRVFPWHAGRYGYPALATGNTKRASPPGGIAQGGLRVTADGDTKLKLDWDEPTDNGGSPVTHYLIQVNNDRDDDKELSSNAFANWCDVAFKAVKDGRMHTYDGTIMSTAKTGPCASEKPLEGGDLRWFRVIPLNKKANTAPADATTGWLAPIADVAGFPTGTAGQIYQSSIDTALNAYGMTGTSAPPSAPHWPGG